jgi:hypothetical protein
MNSSVRGKTAGVSFFKITGLMSMSLAMMMGGHEYVVGDDDGHECQRCKKRARAGSLINRGARVKNDTRCEQKQNEQTKEQPREQTND